MGKGDGSLGKDEFGKMLVILVDSCSGLRDLALGIGSSRCRT